MIEPYLEDLERRLDPVVEDELDREWDEFLEGRCSAPFFSPKRKAASPAGIEWPRILINTAVKDLELMLLRELAGASQSLASGSGCALNIRSNYGTAIMSSMFGVDLFFLEDHHDTLPTSYPLADGSDGIRRLLDAGVPELNCGWAPNVFEAGAYFREKLAAYPNIRKYVRIYHPDLQGPDDVAEMIWGCDMLLALYDEPELVKSFMELITATYRKFMTRWEKEFPPLDRFCHWGWQHKGRIVLRNDSGVNLSPELYEEFSMPYDSLLLKEFGGGVVHTCGRGDHYIDKLAALPEFMGLQLSQPEYNDMERIFTYTVDRGIPLLDLPGAAVKEAVVAGRDLHGLVHTSKYPL